VNIVRETLIEQYVILADLTTITSNLKDLTNYIFLDEFNFFLFYGIMAYIEAL